MQSGGVQNLRLDSNQLFDAYIELELSLGCIDKCRALYERFVQFSPSNAVTWVKFAEFEVNLDEKERSYAILDIATKQALEMPEVAWKGYINIASELNDWPKVREVYSKLLQVTGHTKVWLSYAKFEEDCEEFELAWKIFEQAFEFFKENNEKSERNAILEHWIEFAERCVPNRIEELLRKKPQKVVKRRRIEQLEGEEDKWEEFYDYVFPEDGEDKKGLKLMEMAKKWAEEGTN